MSWLQFGISLMVMGHLFDKSKEGAKSSSASNIHNHSYSHSPSYSIGRGNYSWDLGPLESMRWSFLIVIGASIAYFFI